MNNAELIEVRVCKGNAVQYSYLVECDYNGQELLDIVSEELARGFDNDSVEVVPFRLLSEDGTVATEVQSILFD